MMTTTHIQPFYLRKPWAELFFHRFQCFCQIICILLAKRMKMQAVQSLKKLRLCCNLTVKYQIGRASCRERV